MRYIFFMLLLCLLFTRQVSAEEARPPKPTTPPVTPAPTASVPSPAPSVEPTSQPTAAPTPTDVPREVAPTDTPTQTEEIIIDLSPTPEPVVPGFIQPSPTPPDTSSPTPTPEQKVTTGIQHAVSEFTRVPSDVLDRVLPSGIYKNSTYHLIINCAILLLACISFLTGMRFVKTPESPKHDPGVQIFPGRLHFPLMRRTI